MTAEFPENIISPSIHVRGVPNEVVYVDKKKQVFMLFAGACVREIHLKRHFRANLRGFGPILQTVQ